MFHFPPGEPFHNFRVSKSGIDELYVVQERRAGYFTVQLQKAERAHRALKFSTKHIPILEPLNQSLDIYKQRRTRILTALQL